MASITVLVKIARGHLRTMLVTMFNHAACRRVFKSGMPVHAWRGSVRQGVYKWAMIAIHALCAHARPPVQELHATQNA